MARDIYRTSVTAELRKQERKKIAAVRKFRMSVRDYEFAADQSSSEERAEVKYAIQRRQACYLLKLILNRDPTKKEIDQALHLEDMD